MTDDWSPMDSAPKDKEIEIYQDGAFPIRAYFGGGADKAWRSVTTHQQIFSPKFWRLLKK